MSLSGWITPKREFIESPNNRHMSLVSSDERMQPDKVKEIVYDLDRLEKECAEYGRQHGNHNAEWHRYEMAMDDAVYEIWDILMNCGYIRICGKDDLIYFECSKNTIKEQFNYCKEWADSFGCKAVFEIVGRERI
jgi:hypothetical protein